MKYLRYKYASNSAGKCNGIYLFYIEKFNGTGVPEFPKNKMKINSDIYYSTRYFCKSAINNGYYIFCAYLTTTWVIVCYQKEFQCFFAVLQPSLYFDKLSFMNFGGNHATYLVWKLLYSATCDSFNDKNIFFPLPSSRPLGSAIFHNVLWFKSSNSHEISTEMTMD